MLCKQKSNFLEEKHELRRGRTANEECGIFPTNQRKLTYVNIFWGIAPSPVFVSLTHPLQKGEARVVLRERFFVGIFFVGNFLKEVSHTLQELLPPFYGIPPAGTAFTSVPFFMLCVSVKALMQYRLCLISRFCTLTAD